MTALEGVQASAITPRGKNGEVDFGAAFELIDYLCRGGVAGILLFGPAGEYPAFPPEDRARLLKLGAKRSRVPVLAGVGAATIDISLELAREAQYADAAGLVLPPPYFFRYDQDDLRAFYLEFAAETGGDPPLYIYRSAELDVETTLDLWLSGRFAGVIDAAGEPAEILQIAAAGAPVACGDDRSAGRCGARVLVSGAACAAPELVSALERALRTGPPEEIRTLDHTLQDFLRWADRFPEPVALKLATGLRGLKTGPLGVPLSPSKVKDLDAFRDWFQQWLPGVRKLAVHA